MISFSTTSNEYSVSVHIHIAPGITITFTPESYEHPSASSSTGVYTGGNCNGNFDMSWDCDSFEFNVAKCGDGEGGELKMSISRSDIDEESWTRCLNDWIYKLDHLEEEE